MCHSWISGERRNISPGNLILRKFGVLEETQALPVELSWHINIQCPTHWTAKYIMKFVHYKVPREASIEMFFIQFYALENLYKYEPERLLTGGNI